MSRSSVNFLLDAFLAFLFLGLLSTASVLWLVFPGPHESAGWTVLGASYDGWLNGHFGLLSLFGVAILVHVLLHWTWVCGFVLSKASRRLGRRVRINDSEKTLYGVVTLIGALTLLGVVFLAANLSVSSP